MSRGLVEHMAYLGNHMSVSAQSWLVRQLGAVVSQRIWFCAHCRRLRNGSRGVQNVSIYDTAESGALIFFWAISRQALVPMGQTKARAESESRRNSENVVSCQIEVT